MIRGVGGEDWEARRREERRWFGFVGEVHQRERKKREDLILTSGLKK